MIFMSEKWGFDSRQRQEIFSPLFKSSRAALGPKRPPNTMYRGLNLRDQSGRSVKITTLLCVPLISVKVNYKYFASILTAVHCLSKY
jgi:hypothetical protein